MNASGGQLRMIRLRNALNYQPEHMLVELRTGETISYEELWRLLGKVKRNGQVEGLSLFPPFRI